MNYLNPEKLNEIRNSVDIVSVISSYIPLVPKGKNYFGVCPFHDDNHPSMSVSNDKKIYKCFSCGATGNVFKFLMDYENIPFLEAVKKVADLGGISVDIKNIPHHNSNNTIYQMYDLSLKFYTNNINTLSGKKAKEYLLKRGLNDDIIKEFQIGLSLAKNNDLYKLLKKKFNDSDLLKSGLIGKNEYDYFDLFRDRIMFPLYDLQGNVVAYSGRIYDDSDKPKYFNTRETELFKKGELLYNYHRVKNAAREKNTIIIMEGFMDVIRAYSIGLKNVVASMGTAVTKKQATLLKRLASNIILCFDGDEAGAKATMACGDELINAGVTPKVVRLEDNLDPDEYILKHGKEAFYRKIENPITIMDFKLEYLKTGKNLSSSVDEAKYINEMIKEINKIDDDILREVTIKKITEKFKIDENIIKRKLENKPVKKKIKKEEVKTDKYEVAQRNLVNYMLISPEVINIYNSKVSFMPIKEYRLLAREIFMFYKKYGYINEAELIDFMERDEDLLSTLAKISKANLKEKYTNEEIEDYVKTITDYNIKKRTKKLKEQVSNEIDPIKQAQIAQEIIKLKQRSVEDV